MHRSCSMSTVSTQKSMTSKVPPMTSAPCTWHHCEVCMMYSNCSRLS